MVRLSMRGSTVEGRGFNGSESAGGIGFIGSSRGSRGSELRTGVAIAVPPLFGCKHNARTDKRFHLEQFQEKWEPIFRPELRKNKYLERIIDSMKR